MDDDAPFEAFVEVVDGWLTVIRLSGDGCSVEADEIAPMRRAIDDDDNRWFLLDPPSYPTDATTWRA